MFFEFYNGNFFMFPSKFLKTQARESKLHIYKTFETTRGALASREPLDSIKWKKKTFVALTGFSWLEKSQNRGEWSIFSESTHNIMVTAKISWNLN